MIEKGKKYSILKDTPEHPLKSPNTHLAAAIIACGGRLAEGGYADTVGNYPDGTPRRTVVWLFEEKGIPFYLADGTNETINTSEFIRRWNDLEWISENTEHPISFIKAYQIQLAALRDHIKKSSPLVEVRRGGSVAYIDPKGDPERNRKLLAKL